MNARMLLVGDIILDHYEQGRVAKLDQCNPVPVFEVASSKTMLGGLGLFDEKLMELAPDLRRALVSSSNGLDSTTLSGFHFYSENPRGVSRKERSYTGNQMIARRDVWTEDIYPEDWRERISTVSAFHQALESLHNDVDAIVICDYGKGTVNGELMAEIRKVSNEQNAPIYLDPYFSTEYSTNIDSADCLKINLDELSRISPKGKSMEERAQYVHSIFNIPLVVVTLGSAGAYASIRNQASIKRCLIPGSWNIEGKIGDAYSLETEILGTDTCGAGDAFFAGLVLSLQSKIDIEQALEEANMSASQHIAQQRHL